MAAGERASMGRLSVRALGPGDWPAIEELFGERGACGGCWCMYWRVRGGKAWDAAKGAPNKRAFRSLVHAGSVSGVLAFDGERPVGWCNIGPRGDYERLQHSRVLRSPEERAWAVTCFYIPAPARGRGVAGALLRGAVDLARRSGAPALEGYPVVPREGNVPAAFAWTGVPAIFERNGFRDVTPEGASRPIYRRVFRRKKA